jgi:hypothetical protein
MVDWSFDFAPPAGRKRHHVKIATTYAEPVVELEMAFKAQQGETLDVSWSAIGESPGYDLLETDHPMKLARICTIY